MVHMSSHAYERSGLYHKGVEVNNLADNNLLYYDLLAKNLALTKHSPHYFAVQSYCALTAGMYSEAMRYAQRCRKSVAPTAETTYDQYLYMIPVMTMVRMGKWDQILNDSVVVDRHWTYASLLSDFAKGIALVNTGQIDSASAHLEQLRIKMKDPVLTKRRIPFNSPIQAAGIAENILNGAILFARNDRATAINSFEKAVELEDKLIYTEPKDWPIPSRQFLGAYLLKAGKPSQAQKVYVEDLIYNPGNGWSLLGLYNSIRAQGKKQNRTTYKAKYQIAFAHADQIPSSSVFMK
jgi:tetratricopeptide (TPR) repeat protein